MRTAQTLQDKAFQLLRLALTKGGCSTERWAQAMTRDSLFQTGFPCQCSLPVAGSFLCQEAVLGFRMAKRGSVSCLPPQSGVTSVFLCPWQGLGHYARPAPLQAVPSLPRYSHSSAAAIGIPQDRLTSGRGGPAHLSPHPSLGHVLFSDWVRGVVC